MNLHRFKASGIGAFRGRIAELRAGGADAGMHAILRDAGHVERLEAELPEACPVFETKLAMVSWLCDRFAGSGFQPDERDVGLWSWLAAYLFESICPSVNGRRKINADPHYILDVANYRRTYRHLVAAPWRLHAAAGDHASMFLNERPSVHGDLMEHSMGRLFLMRIPAVAETMVRIYQDPATGRARRGIMPKKPKKGDFRNRFHGRIRQLLLTYDLMAMNTDQLMGHLGEEFTSVTAG
jgi:hypothetical protein